MRKYNILVTGVGAIIGYGVISSLRKSKYDVRIVGMDIFDDAVGQVWSDVFIQAIPAALPEYIPFLRKCIAEHDIDLVFFGTEQEIEKCFHCREELGDDYKKLVINRENLIDMTADKWDTACFLMENGLDHIPSSIEPNFDVAVRKFGLPLLMKPRHSYASKGIQRVHSREEFDAWAEEYREQFMVQQLVGDENHEYTAATFGFGDGTCITPIVLRRKLSKAGATDKAVVEELPQLTEEIFKMVRILKPLGPTNFQFRLHEGKYLLLEINPRISSSTSIRAAFGYNEAEMCIRFFIEGERFEEPIIRTGRAIRYITEAVEYDDCSNI